jgi:hypothetical protein
MQIGIVRHGANRTFLNVINLTVLKSYPQSYPQGDVKFLRGIKGAVLNHAQDVLVAPY